MLTTICCIICKILLILKRFLFSASTPSYIQTRGAVTVLKRATFGQQYKDRKTRTPFKFVARCYPLFLLEACQTTRELCWTSEQVVQIIAAQMFGHIREAIIWAPFQFGSAGEAS